MLEEIADAHGLKRYPEAVAEGLIEPGIQPLTDALYESGANPLASCEGHTRSIGHSGVSWLLQFFGMPASTTMSTSPYAMFSASESYARCLQQKCDDHIRIQAFIYNWWVRAHFVPGEYELVWMIQLNDSRSGTRSFDLVKARQDIRQLALVARQAAVACGFTTNHPRREL
ncbi:hypothetical protein FIU88_18260 (plasmid) [Halomonas sp. THAF12]|uniref:hypothetical protein n=1 Tax=Halomonas sp. THAF12 TaxID=2587849 RepID=UPI0012695E68|nr:hypothetical protein [Halomonas sp. THAF12]QFT86895.1 hypothetical protein FIU88_18260 [Halomonas sp. THAF12]